MWGKGASVWCVIALACVLDRLLPLLGQGVTLKNFIIIEPPHTDCEMVSSDTELLVRERLPQSKCPRPPSCNPLYPCIKFKERVTDCVAIPIAMYR